MRKCPARRLWKIKKWGGVKMTSDNLLYFIFFACCCLLFFFVGERLGYKRGYYEGYVDAYAHIGDEIKKVKEKKKGKRLEIKI
jgi:hypothetical protein